MRAKSWRNIVRGTKFFWQTFTGGILNPRPNSSFLPSSVSKGEQLLSGKGSRLKNQRHLSQTSVRFSLQETQQVWRF